MVAAEVRERHAVAHRAGGRAEFTLEDRVRVGASDRMHRVEGEPQARRERRPQRREVEDLAHQLDIVSHRIDHLDLHIADALTANVAEVYIGGIEGQDSAIFSVSA